MTYAPHPAAAGQKRRVIGLAEEVERPQRAVIREHHQLPSIGHDAVLPCFGRRGAAVVGVTLNRSVKEHVEVKDIAEARAAVAGANLDRVQRVCACGKRRRIDPE